jgi:mannose-6-phosphate isomerase-like protein (cupin superfamily)
MDDQAAYQHTQRSPLCLLIYGLALVLLALGVVLRAEPLLNWLLPLVGLGVALLAPSFHYLAVEDQGDRLAIHFGPLPLFRRSVRYEDIVGAEIGRTSILDGWGIHLSLRGGWVWNIWGRECVVLRLRHSRLTIGTDDAPQLLALINKRLAKQTSLLESIFSNIQAPLEEEQVDVLLQLPSLRIQRIVSHGQASPEGFWYDQTENEWVVVLQGEAGLQFEANPQTLHLRPGDHVLITAHQKHRVAWTLPNEPTVWLAVFFQ